MNKIDAATISKMQELMRAKLAETGLELKDENQEKGPVFPLWSREKVNALKNLQVKITDVEAKYFEEIQNLDRKFMSMFNPLYDERMKIITGEKEKLSEEETKWNYADECIYEEASVEVEKVENKKILPRFWLDALKSTKMVSEIIAEHDEPVLEHLTDIRCRIHEEKPYGYTIEFHFGDNDYFTNKVLTKTYELICEKVENRPFLVARGHFYKCTGCTIHWKKDKNLNFKIVKVCKKNKKTKKVNEFTKEEEQETFFSLFNTPYEDGIKPSIKKMLLENNTEMKDLKKAINEDEDEDEGDAIADDIAEADFDICRFLKDTFIPKAILYYTGELVDDDYEEYDGYDEEDENEDEEASGEEGEDDEDGCLSDDSGKKVKKPALIGSKVQTKSNNKSGEPTPSECKQN